MLRRADAASLRPRRGWPRSVRARLAVSSAVASAVVLLVVGIVLLQVLDHRLDDDVENALAQRYDVVAGAVATSGAAGIDTPSLPSTTVLPDSERVAQVLSSAGAVIAAEPSDVSPLLSAADVQRALAGEITVVQDAPSPRVVHAGPVSTSAGPVVVALGASLGPNRQAVSRARELLLIAWSPASLLAGAAGWLLAGAALRPVERLRRTAARLEVRDASGGLPVPRTGDEIERLAGTLDQLIRRLHAALRERQDHVAQVAHELRTPLTTLRGELEILDASTSGGVGGSGGDGLRAARAAADRFADHVEQLLLLGTSDRGADLLHLEVVEPRGLIAGVVGRHLDDAREAGVALRLTGVDGNEPAAEHVICDPVRISQIVDNLVTNALAAAPRDGSVEVDVTVAASRWRIEILDTGPGFAEIDGGPDAWFDRFRTGSGSAAGGRSLGLGLPIVRELARAHGGDATAHHREGGGAVVVVDLPVSGSRNVLEETEAGAPLTPTTRARVPAPGRGNGRRPQLRGPRR